MDSLREDLHSPVKESRWKALQTVRKEKRSDLVPELQVLYDRERNLDVKREILKAFADLGGRAAVDGLVDALHSHVPELQLEAVRRLSRLQSPQAKPAFLRILEGEEWDLIRLILDRFAPPVGRPEDLPVLFSVLQRAPNQTIKYLATRAINAIQQF